MGGRTLVCVCASLFAALVLSAGSAPAASTTAALIPVGDCVIAVTWPANNATLAANLVIAVNTYRTTNLLPAFVVSPTLMASAAWKASHMAEFGYFDHPDYGPPATTTPARTLDQRFETCGYPVTTPGVSWGENIAAGQLTVATVMAAWIASPLHKANLDNPAFTALGVGIALADDGTPYWVQTFGSVAGTVGVRVRGLSAAAGRGGVVLRWRTGSEVDIVGFNLYREVKGKRVRINRKLIPSGVEASGRSYSFLDRRAPKRKTGVRYLVQAVNLDGTRTWSGSVRVTRG